MAESDIICVENGGSVNVRFCILFYFSRFMMDISSMSVAVIVSKGEKKILETKMRI